jgi:hypothetical protein
MALILPGRAAAQSGTVTDDGFLSSNATTQLVNLNGQGIILVVAGSSATVGSAQVGTTKAYIKFQLQSSLPPNIVAANVEKATLKLFLSTATNPSGAIDIYPVTSSWTESTLNPSSPPTIASTAYATGIAVGKANSFLATDVTSLVQEWLNGPSNGGIANDGIALVADTSTSYVVFDSKEGIVTSHEPRLEIVLANTGPQGPTGPAGAQGATGATGPAGAAGAAGTPGNAATVQVGTTMTVTAGTPASVLNGGTSNAAVLNFLIPQGPIGLTGAQGPQGPVGINNRGAWSNASSYNLNDAVFDSASYWLAIAANSNSEPSPTSTNWQLLAGGIVNRGRWNNTSNYNVNDAVSDGGSYWLALMPTSATATPPTSCEPSQATCAADWQLLAAQGLQGQPGAQGQPGSAGPAGAPGAAATVQVGNVTTGAPGSQAAVSNSGSPNAAILNFTIPQGVAGTGAAPSSVLPAFLPGPLTQKYAAASLVPDSAITVTRISAALKTPPGANCQSTVLRVGNGSTGQDVVLIAGQSGDDSGAMSLPTAAGSTLQVQVQTPANCPQTNPADANVVVEYRGQQSGDTQACAQSGLVCNGICEETLSDPSNCGACGKNCGSLPNVASAGACTNGSCAGYTCSSGYADCTNTGAGCATNVKTDSNNCGSCGNACASGNTCCSSSCTTTSSDPANCGGCGRGCFQQSYPCCDSFGNPQDCNGGYCLNFGCSACTAYTQTCSNGVCTCPTGQTACSSACVTLTDDPSNCGACGHSCGVGAACYDANGNQVDCYLGTFAQEIVISPVCLNSACLPGTGVSCTANSQCMSNFCSPTRHVCN